MRLCSLFHWAPAKERVYDVKEDNAYVTPGFSSFLPPLTRQHPLSLAQRKTSAVDVFMEGKHARGFSMIEGVGFFDRKADASTDSTIFDAADKLITILMKESDETKNVPQKVIFTVRKDHQFGGMQKTILGGTDEKVIQCKIRLCLIIHTKNRVSLEDMTIYAAKISFSDVIMSSELRMELMRKRLAVFGMTGKLMTDCSLVRTLSIGALIHMCVFWVYGCRSIRELDRMEKQVSGTNTVTV